MFGDVNYDPNKSIDDYDEFTCDATLVLLEYSFGTDQVYLVEEGEGYILVEADAIFKVHGKKRMREELNNLNLKVHLDEPRKKIDPNTDIYLVNSYGKTKLFYKACKNIFLGGSLIMHGGQNPLEATRYGCRVLHGPNVSNFKEIYKFLGKKIYQEKLLIKINLLTI